MRSPSEGTFESLYVGIEWLTYDVRRTLTNDARRTGCSCAQGETRTRTLLPAEDFESSASTVPPPGPGEHQSSREARASYQLRQLRRHLESPLAHLLEPAAHLLL